MKRVTTRSEDRQPAVGHNKRLSSRKLFLAWARGTELIDVAKEADGTGHTLSWLAGIEGQRELRRVETAIRREAVRHYRMLYGKLPKPELARG